MFRGNLPAKIDEQGRIKIPSAHRQILDMNYGEQVYVTSVTGYNVLIYPMHEWEDMEAKLLEPPKLLPGKLKFLRNTSYYGQVGKVDRQSRILIPVRLREAAEIDAREVDVMGQLNYLEIWNRERFQEVLKKDPYTEVDALALAEIGI
jgi:MraZ protein